MPMPYHTLPYKIVGGVMILALSTQKELIYELSDPTSPDLVRRGQRRVVCRNGATMVWYGTIPYSG
jgi:hypothetical protein